MFKVIKFFTDMQDGNHPYRVGDEFPREGVNVLPSRIKELAGSDNRQGTPLIEEVVEKDKDFKKPRKTKTAKAEDEE